MPPRIFLTGATGYIGGDALYALYHAHPEYEIAVLVRSEEKGKAVQHAFPNVRLVMGDLDSAEVLEAEAAKADVVVHTADASDNEPAAKAIAKGLASGHTEEDPGYWLHTGGAGILCWESMRPDAQLGAASARQYNDWSDVDALTHLPADAFHKRIDDIVLAAGSGAVRTAILCPPTIYGRGRGPANTRSRQVYELARLILTAGYIPVIGAGRARWNNVHVADLSALFVLLVDAALAPPRLADAAAQLWNANGYFLVENGEHAWTQLARRLGHAAVALGVFTAALPERELAKDKAVEQAGFEALSWGFNSRGSAQRARKLLGWEPKAPALEDSLEEIVRDEMGRLGME